MANCAPELASSYSTSSEIRYLDRLDLYKTEKPYEITFSPVNVAQSGARRTNFSLQPCSIQFRDFTELRDSFSTDTQGFELASFPTVLSPSQLQDADTVESRYYAEVESFLEGKYAAKKVFIFDSTFRETKRPPRDSSAILRNRQKLRPASDCHVDQSPGSIRRRIQHNFPSEAESLLKHRVRVINIWRPLVWPTHSHPLAMCDWRSTVAADYTRADHMTPVWEGESMQVYHNPGHRWWFAKSMGPDDVLLLKMYDSEAEREGSEVAMCTPHCSFDWKDAPEGTQSRVSMEIRAIIFS